MDRYFVKSVGTLVDNEIHKQPTLVYSILSVQHLFKCSYKWVKGV